MTNTSGTQSKAQKRSIDPEYRKLLTEAGRKSQEDYDKTVLSLSGGALGVSFIFIKDIVGSSPVVAAWLLLVAWLCWAASSTAILVSYYTSGELLRYYIDRCDDGTIHESRNSSKHLIFTKFLNISGATAFVLGVIAMSVFVFNNIEKLEISHDRKETVQSSPKKSTVPTTTAPTTKPSP